MRVKEGAVGSSSEMGKKTRKTKQTDYHNTSDEETIKSALKPCSHVDKGVSLNSVKKGIKNAGGATKLGQCQACSGDLRPSSGKQQKLKTEEAPVPTTVEDEVVDADMAIWLCLSCGNQGCGRNSVTKHALKHYETPRSSSHNLAVCVTNWQIWCYKCDDEVAPDESKKLQECVDWVRKEMGIGKTANDKAASKKNQESEGESTPTKGLFKSSSNPAKIDGMQKVKGLTNLGNTCFFNAVMQSMTQTHILRSVLLEKCHSDKEVTIPEDTHVELSLENGGGGAVIKKREGEEDEEEEWEDDDDDMCNQPLFPRKITLSTSGSLTSSLVNFLDEMNKQSKGSNVNPRALFNQICQKAPRFKGYQQQDSHELLRYLMDGMKAEEIKRMQEGILTAFDYNPKKSKNVPDNVRKQIKAYGLRSKHTFVDTVFGGHLISSVRCHECNTISEVLEPFLDLSLPIVEAKGNKKNLHSAKSTEKAPTLLEKSAEASNKQTEEAEVKKDGPSKHQQQKAKDKLRKENKKKNKRGRSNSATTTSNETTLQQDTPTHSDNEDRKEGGDGHMYDADSETSLFDRPGISNNKFDVLARLDNLSLGSDGGSRRGSGPNEMVVNKTIGEETVKSENGDDERTQFFQKMGHKPPTGNKIQELSKQFSGLSVNDSSGEQSSTSSSSRSGKPQEGDNGKRYITTATVDNKDKSGNNTDEDTNKTLNDSDEETNARLEPDGEKELLNHMDAQDGDSDAESNVNLHSKTKTNFIKGKKANFEPQEQSVEVKPIPPPLVVDKEANKLSIASGGTPVVNHNSVTSPPSSPRTKVITPLTARYNAKHMECSVQSCLSQFTAPEWLTGANRFGCETCAKKQRSTADEKKKSKVVYTDASKQLLIHQPPAVLTLHLKRFQQVGYTLRKITRHINFPLILDLAPFCSTGCKRFADDDNSVRYSLYGVVEHSGRLQFGHYTAFVKARHPSEALQRFALSVPQSLNTVRPQRKKSWQQDSTTSTTSMSNGIGNHLPNGINHNSQQVNNSASLQTNNLANSVASGDYSGIIRPHSPNMKPPEGKWYYISDTHVTESQESKVLNAQAYILFYERLL